MKNNNVIYIDQLKKDKQFHESQKALKLFNKEDELEDLLLNFAAGDEIDDEEDLLTGMLIW